MTTNRLERLVEGDACCADDASTRLAELHTLAASVDSVDAAGDVRTLSALGSDTRYRLVRLISAADEALCVCELEPLVDVSESAVSHALSSLVDAGLLTRHREGRWRYYETTARAERMLGALDEGRA